MSNNENEKSAMEIALEAVEAFKGLSPARELEASLGIANLGVNRARKAFAQLVKTNSNGRA